MKPENPDPPREGLDGWIDERIRQALMGVLHPIETRIDHLRVRVEGIQARIHRLSARLEQARGKRHPPSGPPGAGTP